jgi:hypothetical protein
MATNFANYASTTAKSKSDVDQMDKRQRLWDSLSYTYGLQKDESNKSFDKAISQQDRTLLGRGMQRSSYGMQTLGDLQTQKMKAANDIGYAQIADYENRLQELEKQEQEQANWQASFDENQRQFNENLGFQKSEAERSQQNWQSEYDEQRRQFDENMAYQKERSNVSDAQWQKEYDEKLREFDAQFEEQKRQYEQNFAYQQTSDAQSLYYNYVASMAANGTDPTDELLAKAGLTRADFNALKQQAKTSGGGGGRRNTGGNNLTGIDAEVYNRLTNPQATDNSITSLFGSTPSDPLLQRDITNYNRRN